MKRRSGPENGNVDFGAFALAESKLIPLPPLLERRNGEYCEERYPKEWREIWTKN